MPITDSQRQRLRLFSERWMGERATQRLADLLSTMLNPRIPQVFNGGLTLRAPAGGSPLTFRNFSPGDTVFNFKDPYGKPAGEVTFDDGLKSKDANGKDITNIGLSLANNLWPATIEGGTGDTYSVTVYFKGRSNEGQTVTATHPQITVDTEQIPAGTNCQVYRTAGAYEITGIMTWL